MWLTADVTVSVPITHPGLLAVAVLLQVQNCLFTVVRPSIWDKSSDIKIGQWGQPWLVWYVPCKRRCVPRFTKLKHRHRHRNDRRWRCEIHSDSVGTRWQSVGEPHDAIFSVSDELSLEWPLKSQLNVLLQSRASIMQIYQSIFQINRPERKCVYSKPCHVLRGEKCPDAYRMFALKYRVRRDLNTDVSVFEWHARLRLATRWRLAVAKWLMSLCQCRSLKMTARKLPRCGAGARGQAPARKVHTVICHRSGQHYLKFDGPTYI